MSTKVAINGFGRIGRNILRALFEANNTELEVVAINDLISLENAAHMFEFDTVHGRFQGEVSTGGGALIVNGKRIRYTSERDPANLPWGDVGVALECTGLFRSKATASLYLEAGAKRVLMSAPSKGDAPDNTVVYGVNHDSLQADHIIVSNASCTTNCLAPAAQVLHNAIGIKRGFMTTVHSYTASQPVLDAGAGDLRRARAAAQNIIPTSTGAAIAVGLVLPELDGKLDGVSMRVPTANVSAVDLTFEAARDTTVEEINSAVSKAADSSGSVLGVELKPLVSSDFNHNPLSSILDAEQTRVMDGNFCRVLLWYDNEWGFSNRMIDTASAMARLI